MRSPHEYSPAILLKMILVHSLQPQTTGGCTGACTGGCTGGCTGACTGACTGEGGSEDERTQIPLIQTPKGTEWQGV